ncbi:unnamed protein product [Candidula unifasciata]|uniref:SH2 domain-containing protein n=1 Tax=Candidula unifasciata TaxID=100452 RepID=A0A8S3YGY1_9EUPU|nr:unnamed protein product [Candidula unifasciata]
MAQKLADAEAEAVRLKEEAALMRRIEEEKQRVVKEKAEREAEMKRQQEEAELYKSIKEARLAFQRMELEKKNDEEKNKRRLSEIEEEEKQARRRSRDVANSIRDKRSSEIFTNLQKKRHDLEKQALEGQKEVETSWQEQEKKAKEAEIKMRETARQARTEYRESLRRSMNLMQAVDAFAGTPLAEGSKAPIPPKRHKKVTSLQGGAKKIPRPAKPENRQMIVDWFVKEEKDRVRVLDPATRSIVPWFHGIITRADSEKLLLDKPKGTFLVRVSERVWGYTLSYRSVNRCKHFLVDASDSGYQFIGADQTVHESLAHLVKFHKDNPVTISGQEKLLYPCGQTSTVPDFSDLFKKV